MTDTRCAADDAPLVSHGEATLSRDREVFAGLTPSRTMMVSGSPTVRSTAVTRARSAAFTTVPVVLTGAIALSLGLAGPAEPAHARKPLPPKPEHAPAPQSLRTALAQLGSAIVPGAFATSAVATRAAPAVYTVDSGDTVSSIAQRFGLSTASVLTLNGLSWRSVIFPGQILTLTTAPVKTTAPPPARTHAGRYTIVKGDTVSSVAARFGVTTQSLLTINGLNRSSIIYPGQLLVIPGREPAEQLTSPPVVGVAVDTPQMITRAGDTASSAFESSTPSRAATVAALAIAERPVLPTSPARPRTTMGSESPSSPPSGPPSGGSVTPLTAEMRMHAATIVRVGHELGVPQYGIVIALATAMQESSLRNLSWGDRDSVGLFQQRPSSGWGTAADLQVPSHAARLFYVGRPGYTRGLLSISGWQGMTLTRAAQAVQISGHPDAYAKWETSAWAWYYELT